MIKYFLTFILSLVCLGAFAQSIELQYDQARSVDHLDGYIQDGNFGGISGLEYVQERNKWYLITDGKDFKRQSYVFEIDGSAPDLFPEWKKPKGLIRRWLGDVSYAEAIRFDGKSLWFCTEERVNPPLDGVFEKGSIGELDAASWYSGRRVAPYESNFENRGVEAICFTNQNKLVTISEWPLRDDGDLARLKVTDHTSGDGSLLASYAYKLDIRSCLAKGQPSTDTHGNGISEILSLAEDRFLILERCYNGTGNVVKLYEASRGEQTTVLDGKPLKNAPVHPLSKKELFDFSSIKDLKIDNLEGMTWGPDKKTLVIVSDNNFEKDTGKQKSQWIVLKVTTVSK